MRPAYGTALGTVILAALRPDRPERDLQRVEPTALTPKTMADPQSLRREIDDLRRSGVGFDDGEFDPVRGG